MARCSNCGRREGQIYTASSSDTYMTGQDTYDSRTTSYDKVTGEVRQCPDCRNWFCDDCMYDGRCYEDNERYKKLHTPSWECDRCHKKTLGSINDPACYRIESIRDGLVHVCKHCRDIIDNENYLSRRRW